MPELSSRSTERAMNFVANNVADFIKRYQKAKESSVPEIDAREAFNDGSPELVQAAQHLDKLESIAEDARNAVDAAVTKFATAHYEEAEALVDRACKKRNNAIQQDIADFKYRVRQAIGLAELVSTEKAFGALDACRREIYELERVARQQE